ncbi:hypothetical protein OAP56_04070 [Rickettsiaceae bacterium]|nr:hypothetical protein [Rickettsiaceae bacterium]
MKNVLLSFPESTIVDSDKQAKKLGISRSDFIRLSVIHELKDISKKNQEDNIISSFNSMKKSKEYLSEGCSLDDGLSEAINIDEGDNWWKK